MKYYIILGLLALATNAVAGVKEVGNGGDAVVCRNDKNEVTSTELLDFYETRVLRGQKIDLGADNLSRDDKVKLAIERLRALNPVRADRYLKYLSTFMSEAQMIPNAKLRDIPDSNQVALPAGCSIEQVVIQVTPRIGIPARYTFDKDLWDKLDTNNQAGLMLHEIIFRESIEANIRDSISVRYFNGIITSNEISSYTQKQYYDLAVALPLPDIELWGYNFAICFPGIVDGEFDACATRKPPTTDDSPDGEGGFLVPPFANWANGVHQSMALADGTKLDLMGPMYLEAGNVSIASFGIGSQTFRIGKYSISTDSNAYCDRPGKEQELWKCYPGNDNPPRWNQITFQDGHIHQVNMMNLHSGEPLLGNNCKQFSLVTFDSSGNVTACALEKPQHISGAHFDLVIGGDYSYYEVAPGKFLLKAETVFNGWIDILGMKVHPVSISQFCDLDPDEGESCRFFVGGAGDEVLPFYNYKTRFPKGTLIVVRQNKNQEFILPDDLQILVKTNMGLLHVSQLALNPDQSVYRAKLSQDTDFENTEGLNMRYSAGSVLVFTDKGKVATCYKGGIEDSFDPEGRTEYCYGEPVGDK